MLGVTWLKIARHTKFFSLITSGVKRVRRNESVCHHVYKILIATLEAWCNCLIRTTFSFSDMSHSSNTSFNFVSLEQSLAVVELIVSLAAFKRSSKMTTFSFFPVKSFQPSCLHHPKSVTF